MKLKFLFPALFVPLILFSPGCNSSKSPRSACLSNLGNGICHDGVSGLMWQNEKSATIKTVEEVQRYVENLRLGGYTDWRLPTRQELFDFVYLFDLHLNGECTCECEGTYWSSESNRQPTAGSWEISANQCDPARQYFRGSQGHVRAVRP